MRTNHKEYGIPYNFNLFEDDYGYPLRMNWETRTKEQAEKYFKKLYYYVGETDDDLNAISFESSCEIEKIIRVIAIDPRDRYKKGNLRLGVITIDLSNVIAPNGKQVYKEYFDKVKEVLKDNELCNI